MHTQSNGDMRSFTKCCMLRGVMTLTEVIYAIAVRRSEYQYHIKRKRYEQISNNDMHRGWWVVGCYRNLPASFVTSLIAF